MIEHEWQIGISGTFDVENYGDLLFPLIAEVELARRLGPLRLQRFSYREKTSLGWPYAVRSLTDLPEVVQSLDGLIIGGGQLIRFDKDIAPGYHPPAPTIHHPTGYWLGAALIALAHGRPVAWNAPGVHGEIPAWAEALMHLAVGRSGYVAVRDEPSRRALEPFAGAATIHTVPDTAFGVAPLLAAQRRVGDCDRLRGSLGLSDHYIVVQASGGLEAFWRFVRAHAQLLRSYQLLVLPIGPALGDRVSPSIGDLPGVVRVPAWPKPLVLAELIGGASAVVGVSLHLCITALAMGVPVFRPAEIDGGKYGALSGFEAVARFRNDEDIDPEWFAAGLRRTGPSPAMRSVLGQLSAHWDRIAATFTSNRGHCAPLPAVTEFWQSLPNELEGWSGRLAAQTRRRVAQDQQLAAQHQEVATLNQQLATRNQEVAALNQQLAARNQGVAALTQQLATRNQEAAALNQQLTIKHQEIAALGERLTALERSKSWRMTAPLRSLRRGLSGRGHGRPSLINLARIEAEALVNDPYRWAFVNALFSPRDAAALAASFPRDHFKTVTGYDGEKGYAYEARALIQMGADTPSHVSGLSAPWRALAAELLSPAYRRAMSKLTGCDLTTLTLEVNVFHYGPGAWLGPHVDLEDKLVTHVLYFNPAWQKADGGCLNILRSSETTDAAADISPIVGNSAVLVRSHNSWHAVSRVTDGCRRSRRSMSVTFYRPGSVSTMWPPGDATPLHRYSDADEAGVTRAAADAWARLRGTLSSWTGRRA